MSDTGISFKRIEKLLTVAGARRRLLFIDTCESGERDEFEMIAMAERTQARQLRSRGATREVKKNAVSARSSPSFLKDRDRYIYHDVTRESGVVVLTSSRGTESSYERDDLQNGVFTAALLHALQSKNTDQDDNGWVSIPELDKVITRSVPKLTYGRQHPSIDKPTSGQEISLPLLGATKEHQIATP